MKTTLAAIAASITLSTTALVPMQASAGISTLGGCYDAVIAWCNDTHPEHASSCAGGGMDQCDEEFGNAVAGSAFDRISVKPNEDGTFKFRLIRQITRLQEREEGGDRDQQGRTGGARR